MFKYHEDEVPMTDWELPDDHESLVRTTSPAPVVKRRPKHLMNQSPGNSTFADYMTVLDSDPDIEGADAELKARKSTPAVVKPFVKPLICTPLPKVAPKMKSTPGFFTKATNSTSDCDSLEEPCENIDGTKSKPGKATPAVKKPFVATPSAALPVQRKATPAMPQLKRPLVVTPAPVPKVQRKGTPAFAVDPTEDRDEPVQKKYFSTPAAGKVKIDRKCTPAIMTKGKSNFGFKISVL